MVYFREHLGEDLLFIGSCKLYFPMQVLWQLMVVINKGTLLSILMHLITQDWLTEATKQSSYCEAMHFYMEHLLLMGNFVLWRS